MAYRGRLIWPFQARIERLDTAATAANAIASQPSGYDRIFREPVRTNAGVDSRVYLPPVAVRCQVTTEMSSYDKHVQLPGGRELEFDVRLTLHYTNLETMGLVQADGRSVFQPSDRLMAIYRRDGVTLLRDFSADPLYCIHVQERSWGLDAHTRNLLMLYFKDRQEGAT